MSRRRRLWAPLFGLALAAQPAAAGAWVQPDGRTRIELNLYHQQTDERYFLAGERIRYFFEGQNRTQALFLDVSHGLTSRLEVAVQSALFRVDFDDLAAGRRSTGLGDTRLSLRSNLAMEPLVVTVGARIKAPTGDFANDAEIVPVGEGQWDGEISLELGRSLWPRPGYVSAQGGYRARRNNDSSGIDPGDEWFWVAEAGWGLPRGAGVRFVARGLHGRDARAFGLPITSLRREAVYLEPALTASFASGWGASLAVRFTVSGRNWPAGPVLSLGISSSF